MALGGSTVGFQPEMIPSSLTKMNNADAVVPFFVTGNDPVLLNTTPVGVPGPLVCGASGIVATSVTGCVAKVTALLLLPSRLTERRGTEDRDTCLEKNPVCYFADFKNSTIARCSWPVMLARRRM